MKRLLLLGVGSALMFTMGGVGPAQADTDGYTIHKSTAVAAGTTGNVTLGGSRCAGCHRAHTAKAEYLLKQAQPGLCYTCHGGQGSFLDVVDGVDPSVDMSVAGNSNALRGGGFAYALINGAAGEMTVSAVGADGKTTKSSKAPAGTEAAPVTSRHQIDGVTQGTMWGNGAVSDTVGAPLAAGKTGVTLECGSCHDPHGNGNYRILKPIPNDAATTAKAAVLYKAAVVASAPGAVPVVLASPEVLAAPAVVGVAVLPVNIPDAAPGARKYTTTDYWSVRDLTVPTVNVAAVGATADMTDGYIANVAAWCTTCHTRYLAGSGSWRTPLTDAGGKVDATFTYRHRGDSASKGGVSRPNCIQCHVSHGTSATMSVGAGGNATYLAPDGQIPAAGSGTAGISSADGTVAGGIAGGTAVGNSRLLRVNDRATCKMCHNV